MKYIFNINKEINPPVSSDRFIYYSAVDSSSKDKQKNINTIPNPIANFIYSYDFKIFLATWYAPIYNVSKPRTKS